jgi:hypothetical protein
MIVECTPITAFQTATPVKAINFDLFLNSTSVVWAQIKTYYKPVADTAWILLDVWDAGNPGYLPPDGPFVANTVPLGEVVRNIIIAGLTAAVYQIGIIVYNQSGGTLATNDVYIANLSLDTSSVQGEFVITGDIQSPSHLVAKEIEVRGLPEKYYDFRIWRTTADETSSTWSDDIFLRTYAEVFNLSLAYPGHSLIGIRAMATDRLYGGRPRITSIATGAPLTIPAVASRFETTSFSDDGIVTIYQVVNGVVVTGMRQVRINAVLPANDSKYIWMVRMDSAGYAQPDRLLTKHYLRVHTWYSPNETQTFIYLQDDEAIPNGTSLMLFHEAADPYISRHTAWAVAKMLIDGSHGRITENGIDWEAFAAWDAWNMELIGGQPRHLFDAVVDFSTDLWSLAMRTAATARGNLMKKGNKYSVWVDKAATHRQVFGEGNSNNLSVSPIPRSDRANILTTTYLDQSANYDQKDISIEDVQGSEFPIVKNIPVQVGVVRESQVNALLQYMLLQNRFVSNTVSFEAGIDSVEVAVGDVFMVASQAKDFSQSGRITTVGVTTVTLDQPFDPETGVIYQLSVWGTDGTIYNWASTLPGPGVVNISKPPGLPDSEHYEYPYVLCKLSAERMKYRCIGIRRTADTMHATLTGIEYRAEVYAND